MKQRPKHSLVFLLGLSLIFTANSAPADTWNINTAVSTTWGSYSGSLIRNQVSETGVRISGDYFEQGGMAIGMSKTRIIMQNFANTNQDNFLLSGRLHYWPDSLPGKLTLSMDAHRISNNDTTGDTDGVSVIAPQLSWLSNDAMIYADIGFANSRYQNRLDAHQYTPTIGFGLNHGFDWIQLRAYLIRGLNPARAANKFETSSLDTKWTHHFETTSSWEPSSFAFNVASGESIYKVDMDAQSVANLSDINTGSVNMMLTWKLTKDSKLNFLAGQSRFRNISLSNDYKLNFGYANLSLDW